MFMHSPLYRTIALVLVVLTTLTTAPISAVEFGSATAAAVGSVTIDGSVQLRGITVAREGTVFSGDRIVVRADSSANLALSGGQIVALTSNTDLTVESDGSIARLALASGSVSFSTSGRSSLQIDVAPYEVVSDTASARVFVLSDKTVGVRVRSGSLMVRNTDSKESFLLTEGQEKLLGRANGAVADPISMIASNLPDPLPAGLPPAPAPQASGMSSGAWVAIIAAVAGGAAAASWVLAGRSKVDESALDAANSTIAGLESTNAGLSATIASLNSDVASLTSDIAGLTSDIADLNSQISGLVGTNNALAADLVTARNLAAVELSALESTLRSIQIALTAEQAKAAIAASSLDEATAAAFVAEAEAIAVEVEVLKVEAAAIQDRMGDIRAELAALGISASVLSDAFVRGLSLPIPPGASQAVIDLINEFNGLADDLGDTQVKINENIDKMKDLLVELEDAGVADLPSDADLDKVEEAAIEDLPPASPSTTVG